jgi:hypothetical protein
MKAEGSFCSTLKQYQSVPRGKMQNTRQHPSVAGRAASKYAEVIMRSLPWIIASLSASMALWVLSYGRARRHQAIGYAAVERDATETISGRNGNGEVVDRIQPPDREFNEGLGRSEGKNDGVSIEADEASGE